MLTNPAGEVVAGFNYSYTPFDDLLETDSGGTADATSCRFTGQYGDADFDLQYHRASCLNLARRLAEQESV